MADRVALAEIMRQSIVSHIAEDERLERLETMAQAMADISGLDVKERTRKAEYIRARTIFAFVARQEGYSQTCIGAFLGINHSTIHHLEKRMESAFDLPEMWQDHIVLYNQFTSAIL